MDLSAPVDPYDEGMLDVGDGHRVAWSIAGNPDGKAAIVLHGGPGSGCSPGFRRWFDLQRYRVVLMDQRGSGLSTPHASEPNVDLSTNTTHHLVADIERLREHLAIDRWLVWGGSWGTTLGLAYAETHPDRVTEMILVSVVTTTASEVEWVTRAMGRVFPETWARFRDGVPPADRDGNLAAAYARLLQDPDPAVHEPAALRWCEWEDTHVATHPGHVHDDRYDDPRFRLAFARSGHPLLEQRRVPRGRGVDARCAPPARHSRCARARAPRHQRTARHRVAARRAMAERRSSS